jgi:TRAP-type C4-dicarboxylate transport system substrate-binding protein
LIEEISKEAAQYGREHMNKMESQAIEEFKKSGVTVTILTSEEKKAFRDATASVIDRYKEICGEEACKAWGIE